MRTKKKCLRIGALFFRRRQHETDSTLRKIMFATQQKLAVIKKLTIKIEKKRAEVTLGDFLSTGTFE